MLFPFQDNNDKIVKGNWTYGDKDGMVYYGSDFKIVAHRIFHSYPIDWTVTLLSLNTKFKVEPAFDDQVIMDFWEGLCDVKGKV